MDQKTTTIAAKKKEQLLRQRMLDDVAERQSGSDFDHFRDLIARDMNAAPGAGPVWTLRPVDYRDFFVVQDFTFATMGKWLREQGIAVSLSFQGPNGPGQPSLLSSIQLSFYESRGWKDPSAIQVKQ